MTESERAAALKTQILNALRAQGYCRNFDYIDHWSGVPGRTAVEGFYSSAAIETGGKNPNDFAEEMARNIVAIFGGRVFIGMLMEEQS